jgi:hypothetical protein
MRVIGIGVSGAGPSVRSAFRIRIDGGIVYLEIEDRGSGANTRTARCAISPDKMVAMGRAMEKIGEGVSLDDVVADAPAFTFNEVSSSSV